MFSEITRIRPACARSPDVAIPIERTKSLESSAMLSPLPVADHALALSDRGLEKVQALAVERGHRGVIHLVGRDLEHLVLEIDGVAGGARLEAGLAVLVETIATAIGGRDMAGRGSHHGQGPHRFGGSGGLVEFRFDQVARL